MVIACARVCVSRNWCLGSEHCKHCYCGGFEGNIYALMFFSVCFSFVLSYLMLLVALVRRSDH